MTKEELVKQHGIENESFDYALPQQWVDEVKQLTGFDYDSITYGFVWHYGGLLFGRPYPLTPTAREILSALVGLGRRDLA